MDEFEGLMKLGMCFEVEELKIQRFLIEVGKCLIEDEILVKHGFLVEEWFLSEVGFLEDWSFLLKQGFLLEEGKLKPKNQLKWRNLIQNIIQTLSYPILSYLNLS